MAIHAIFLLRETFVSLFLFYLLRYFASCLLTRRRLPPGPRGFSVLGTLPSSGSAPHVALARMAKRYGPIMYLKIGHYGCVVASTPDTAKVFFKTLDLYFSNRPVNAAPKLLAYNAQDLVFAEYGPKWKLLRRICHIEMLSKKALKEWSAIRRDEVGLMLRSMAESSQWKEPVMVVGMLVYVIANMIGSVILSRRLFETKGSEANEFKDMVVELMMLAGLFNIGDYVPTVAWMDLQGIEAKMKRVHEKLDMILSRILAEHQALKSEREGRPDMLDVVMAGREEPDKQKLTTDG